MRILFLSGKVRKVKRVAGILKDCDIQNVLGFLTEGLEGEKYKRMRERYDALYCRVLGLGIPNAARKMILTDFRETDKEREESAFCFFGICPCSGKLDFSEKPVQWEIFLSGKTDILVPDCVTEAVGAEKLSAQILWQIEKIHRKDTAEKRNKIILMSFRRHSKSGQSRLFAMEKIIEKIWKYEIDQRILLNEICEYKEKQCLIVKWGDILKQNRDPIPQDVIRRLQKAGQEVRRTVSKNIAAGETDNLCRKIARLDRENTPDIIRCCRRIRHFLSCYETIRLADYQYVIQEHMRVIIEHNPYLPHLPVIYICNKYGEKMELNEFKSELSRLLCMDIYVTDEKLNDEDQVLALIAFYMEYPLRVRRLQEEAMLSVFMEILELQRKKRKKLQDKERGEIV